MKLSRTRSLTLCALSIALLSVSAWVTVPIGPVPVTLQVLVVGLVALILPLRESVAALAVYVLMGAIGLPVFSGMRGGLGVLAGPTGGFLWGFVLGVLVAGLVGLALRRLAERSGAAALAVDALRLVVLLAVLYACGWAQLMAVAGMGPVAAFAAGVAPFVLIDAAKLVAATVLAQAIRPAIGLRRGARG